MDDFLDFIVVFMIFLGIGTAIAAPLLGVAMLLDRQTCHATTKHIGFRSDWGVFSGCRILVNGHWVPLENYYMRDTVKP